MVITPIYPVNRYRKSSFTSKSPLFWMVLGVQGFGRCWFEKIKAKKRSSLKFTPWRILLFASQLTPIRPNADVAASVNLISLFVVVNRVSMDRHGTPVTTVISRRAHHHLHIPS